jgi:rRNA maturation RNase YbeY
MSAIQFHFLQTGFNLKKRTELKNYISNIFKKEKRRLRSLEFIFCSDDYLLRINRQFLNHDYYTDIISFDLSDETPGIVGEIYISIDRVKENASRLGITFREELHRIMIHGALHLCGYKDKFRKQIQLMREKEDFYLRRYLS